MVFSGLMGSRPLKSPRAQCTIFLLDAHALKLLNLRCSDSCLQLPETKPAFNGLVANEAGASTSVFCKMNANEDCCERLRDKARKCNKLLGEWFGACGFRQLELKQNFFLMLTN